MVGEVAFTMADFKEGELSVVEVPGISQNIRRDSIVNDLDVIIV
jgi:hypothetical protein